MARLLSKVVGVLLALGVCAAASGQPTSGALAGFVTDTSGAALPGVTVELAGPALQGIRVAVTDGAGRFRFVPLSPGDGYAVTAKLDGFQTARARDIHVFLGQEGTIAIMLLAAVSESLTVIADAPLIDVRSTSSGVNITASQFDSLPTRRSFQSLTAMASGVSMELAERRADFATSPAVAGATPPENNYLIEGLSTRNVFNGLSGTNITMNFVEEVQVLTGGYPAEFGGATGGVFNVVTKSGGNEFRGDVFAYYQKDAWSAKNSRRRFRATSTRADGIDSTDVGLAIGGPIRRDRLWFFIAYDPTRTTTNTREFVDRSGRFVHEEHQFDTRTDLFAAKLGWALLPGQQIVVTAFGDPTVREGWLGGAQADPPVGLRREGIGTKNYALRYSGWFKESLFEGRIGSHQARSEVIPITELGRTVPRQFDALAGVNHGGWSYFQHDSAARDTVFAKAAHNWGRHQITFGGDIEDARYSSRYKDHLFVFNGPQTDTPPGVGVQDRLNEYLYDESGIGSVRSTAAFLQDEWEIASGVRLNAGVRYQRQVLDAKRGLLAASRFEPDGALDSHRIGELPLDHTWAPRLGIVWDPLRNGRSKLYVHFGRYFESLPLQASVWGDGDQHDERSYYSLVRHDSNNWYNPNGSPLNDDWIEFRSATIDYDETAPVFDSNLKTQFQQEVRAGAEYQFASAWSAGAHYVNRQVQRVIEDFGLFQNPKDPLRRTGYIIGNPSEGTFGQTFPKPQRDYQSIELTLQRRRTTNWQIQSSFVWTRAIGDYEGLYRSNNNQLNPNLTSYYDMPALQKNAYGRLPADRPYQFKAYGSYTLPFRLTISEAFLITAGSPTSALGPELYNGYRGRNIFLTQRGSEGRTPMYSVLDLHADYQLPLSAGALSIIIDIFNATNNHRAIILEEAYIYPGMPGFNQWSAPGNLDEYGNPKFSRDLPVSPYYGTPLVYQSPRTVQVGMKFRY